jgi:hypothetical protein
MMLCWFVIPILVMVQRLVHLMVIFMLCSFIFTLVHVVWMLNLLLSISYSFRKSSAEIFLFWRERLKFLSLVPCSIGLGDKP